MTEAADALSLRAAGWTSAEFSGFSGQIGTCWTRGFGDDREVAFFAEPRHGNENIGTVHGGLLMTFADVALGHGVADALGHAHVATAQLQLQFVATARIGAFVACRPELVRRASQLVFIRGLVTADGKTVASADGIWKVLEPRPR